MIIVTKMVTIMLLLIDRIYREVGSARVRERQAIMIIYIIYNILYIKYIIPS